MRRLVFLSLAGCGSAEPAQLVEYCDGIDNDYDGLIDEGLPDGDLDGINDCVDDQCGPPGGTVEVLASCPAPLGDPWAPTILWHWTGLVRDPSTHNVAMTPSVANLDDDNGDGKVDGDDWPEVVFVAFGYGYATGALVVLDGATGAEKWSLDGFDPLLASVALGDVDQDGRTDLVLADDQQRAVALNASGDVIWTHDEVITDYFAAASLADLDGDGTPEVIAGNLVLDGPTGTRLRALDTAGTSYGYPAVADLDEDGVQEVIIGETVFDGLTGDVRWEGDFTGTYGQWPMVFNADPHPGAEVAMIGAGRYGLWTAEGDPLVNVQVGTLQAGGPCVADFDGDGEPDVAWADADLVRMIHADGTTQWSATISDPSGLASCAGFDVDGDGAAEVLFADEQVFHILDGRTGQERFAWDGHVSGTYFEGPAIADLDHDGHAEVLIAGNEIREDGDAGVAAFTQADGAWSAAGPTWSQHDDAGATISDAGEIPARPNPAWKSWNGYRGRPGAMATHTDLVATITGVCFDNCAPSAAVAVAVHISNLGGGDTVAGLPVTLYRKDGATLSALQTRTLTAAIAGGTVFDGLVFDVTSEEIGADGLVVAVDDDGAGVSRQPECDERNNQAAWSGPTPCP